MANTYLKIGRLTWIMQMGPMQSQKFLKGKEGGKRNQRNGRVRRTAFHIAGFEGTVTQGIRMVSRS